MGIRHLGRALRLCMLAYVQALILIALAHMFWPRDALPETADVIICLGAGVTETGLNGESRTRAAHCADLFHAEVASTILFTGTQAGPRMADFAQTTGVPQAALIVEEASRSTLQNALFSAELIAPDARVVVVTTAYHLPRAWMSFRVMGVDHIQLSPAGPPSLDPNSLAREAFAIWFNLGRVALWWLTPWLPNTYRAALMA